MRERLLKILLYTSAAISAVFLLLLFITYLSPEFRECYFGESLNRAVCLVRVWGNGM